ncbi:hypothetical protein C0580_01490 [Candidatus Parcubacteria bacterium]|nr:MAG: hypothetical protein C0580_01490 [Candidatus Parcubacteria bacterium]
MKKNKTNIIATIGPASLNLKTFQKMAEQGFDFVRINTSYGDIKQYDRILNNLKKIKVRKKIQVILDIKNLDILEYAQKNNIKYIALSFTESPKQIEAVRRSLPGCFVISKIETRVGVKNFDKILDASDGIMIGRGDLANAVSLADIPPLQKEFTKKSLLKQKFFVAATEMMLSMTKKNKPTRAEVNDVATAVFDGSHAVMLSEETAIGKYPVETIKIMKDIIDKAEKWLHKKDLVDQKIKQELNLREFRVAIFGSARIKKNDKLYRQTFDLAKEIGKNNIDIVTGGGPGLMIAANSGHAAGDKDNKSDSFGLRITLPWEIKDNQYLEIKKDFDKFSNRLDYFMALSGAVVVMPGGIGTCLEFFYALQLTQVKHVHPIPIILMGKIWKKLYAWIKQYPMKVGFISPHDIDNVYVAETNEEALDIILKHYKIFNEKGANYYKDIKPYKIN